MLWVLPLVSLVIIPLALYQPNPLFSFNCGSTRELYVNSSNPPPKQILYVPIDIVTASRESERIANNDEQIRSFVEYANEVWHIADISFTIRSIDHITLSESSSALTRDDTAELKQFGRDLLGDRFEDEIIDVIYIKSFEDQKEGGGSTIQAGMIGAVFINEFDSDYRAKWTLAHEFGHTLNLDDVCERDNLMMDYKRFPMTGIRSTILTEEQIMTAKSFAYNAHCPDSSCIE